MSTTNGQNKITKSVSSHTNGTESSSETTIDDIQIATPADVPYTRAEYDLSESNCTEIVLTELDMVCN
jgi:hypothetical protein